MLDISIRINGLDVIVKLNRGIHLCGVNSGTGKTYFSKIIQQLINHKKINAVIVNLQNIEYVLETDISEKELIVVESASAIDTLGKLQELLNKIQDKYVIMDMKEYRSIHPYTYRHARFRFSKNRLEVTD